MKILMARFPYLFWYMKIEEVEIKDNKLIAKNGNEYKFSILQKYKFILTKYIPIFLFFCISFRIQDFIITPIKILEYLVALVVICLAFFTNKILTIVGFLGIVICSYWYMSSLAFIIKYCFLFFVVFNLIKDLKIDVYSIELNKKTVSNFIFLENKQ